jgi:hypothetical protein
LEQSIKNKKRRERTFSGRSNYRAQWNRQYRAERGIFFTDQHGKMSGHSVHMGLGAGLYLGRPERCAFYIIGGEEGQRMEGLFNVAGGDVGFGISDFGCGECGIRSAQC